MRLLRRTPAFTTVITVTLALGIGATTAIYSVVYAALLKPLPFKDPDGLVIAQNGSSLTDATPLSFAQLRQWRDTSGAFETFAGYFTWRVTLGGTSEAEQISGLRSSASLFTTLGVEPVVGHLFTQADESRSAEPVVLLSEAMWRARGHATAADVRDAMRAMDCGASRSAASCCWHRLRPGFLRSKCRYRLVGNRRHLNESRPQPSRIQQYFTRLSRVHARRTLHEGHDRRRHGLTVCANSGASIGV